MRKNDLKYTQNYFCDDKLLDKLINQSIIDRNRLVLEVGTGKGDITKELAKKVKQVISIEYDKKLFKAANKRLKKYPNVLSIYGDFLNHSLPKLDYDIFANIPYNITAQILQKLLTAQQPPINSYLILQKEPAVKYSGQPYGKETMQSILWKPFFDFSIIEDISKTAFKPVPNVKSVFLRITCREYTLIKKKHKNAYFDFIAYLWEQQGNIKKRLSTVFSYKQLKHLAKDLQFSLKDNISSLLFTQVKGLFDYYLIGIEKNKKQKITDKYNYWEKSQDKLNKIHRR